MRTRISMGNKDMVVYRFSKVLEYLIYLSAYEAVSSLSM